MSVNGGGDFEASESWASGHHNWQDYEGPILADGSGPVDPTHPYWTTNQNTNVTVPNNDLSEDGGGGGGGGGSDGAPSTEASPELTDKPLDVQENALSNAPASGERGDATSYWVDEGGNYVDINDTDYRFGDRWETADGRILYANNDDGMVEYQLFEAVDVAIADGDIDLANGIKSDWESYSGVDFPDGTKLDDYYTGHDDWRGPELTEVSYDDADQYKGDVGAGETPTYPNLDWIPDGNSNEYDPDDILGTSPITTDTTDTTTTTGDTDSYNPYADTDNWGDAEWQKVIDAQGGGGDTSGGGTGGTGVNGTDGVNGQNGNNGDNGTDGNDGEAGVDGKDGKDGTDGKNGGDGGDGFGGGLGSASALIGNGSQAARPGNLFDYDKLSPAAYAILGPLLDQMEHLNR
jgi:hypothetical protein